MDTTRILCTGGSGFIGTHLVDCLLANGVELLNIDIAKPKKKSHAAFWSECNILDLGRLKKIFKDFSPSHIIHLAARTTMEGKSLDDFCDNTVGTANVLNAVKQTASVERVIVTSSQHVRKPGSGAAKSDVDYDPLGLYGQSKVITERLTRSANLNCAWTIIRPTTIWGAYHPSMGNGVLKMIKMGVYFHPSGKPVIRSYGYVGNTVFQIEQIRCAPEDLIDKKTFYLGESPCEELDWLNAFSQALTGKNVRVVPGFLIYSLAAVGDLLAVFKIKFPLYAERYRNLTTSNWVPVQATIEQFGLPPFSMDEGVAETVAWLRTQGGIWSR